MIRLLSAWRCRRLRARLVDLAAGDLPQAARDEVEAHVRGCPPCREDLEALRLAPETLAGRSPEDPGPAYWRNQRRSIMRAIREIEARREPQAAAAAPRWDWRMGLVPVAAMLVAVLGLVALRQQWSEIAREASTPLTDEEIAVALLDEGSLLGMRADEIADLAGLIGDAGAELGIESDGLEDLPAFDDLSPEEQEVALEWMGDAV